MHVVDTAVALACEVLDDCLRVLVIDDHDAWREQVCAMLRRTGRWHIVDEGSDGLAAVDKAHALQPDVVSLDVMLPALNGLEAAKRILARAPTMGILFVSLHRSLDVVEAALATGARGYVVKSDPGELLPALEAVAAGQYHLSAVLTGRCADGCRSHEIGFYPEPLLIDEYARVGTTALLDGKAFIFAADASRRQQLQRKLQASGVDVDRALSDGRYRPVDVAELLSQVLVDGRPDRERFWRVVTSEFLKAAKASRGAPARVCACGDGAATVLREIGAEEAIRLERLWDEVARAYNVEVFCGYPLATADDDCDVIRRICEDHSSVRGQ